MCEHQEGSTGPDGINRQVLKACAHQLPSMCTFNLSFAQCATPFCFKKYVPIPKKSHPKYPIDYSPIALTSDECF